jgi:pimeloyl-ACP methyl ester carboxylesterase
MQVPETRYAKTVDGVHIAYQVAGDGPHDFVLVNSAFISNVELAWEWEVIAARLRWLSTRGRLVLFDRRGTGLSDGVSEETPPTLEARMDDIRAAMDAVGVDRAVLCGTEDGAAQCFLFAATYPERTAAIITFGAASRGLWTPESPWLWNEGEWGAWLETVEDGWGSSAFTTELTMWVSPARAGDTAFERSYSRMMRHSLSPAGAVASERMYRDTDVRHVLPLIQAPTLVTHVVEDQV